jgi:hypothetical protein
MKNNCQLIAQNIVCDSKRYTLAGNKNNRHLAEGVLTEANKMVLPNYSQGVLLNDYVTQVYRQYIDKMCVIGLAGVTMTYARFAFLYHDLQAKNVNFVQRFETMYSYLKKDKATLWISEKITSNSKLAMQDCELLTENRYVCATQGNNYIFEVE